MRYVKMIVGILLVAKGVIDCIRLPAVLASAHSHASLAAGHVASGFAAGEAAGRVAGFRAGAVIGALAVLVGGVLLVVDAWRRRQGAAANAVAP